MKKLMAIFGAAMLLAGVATSCSKVCECTVSVMGVSTTTEVNLQNSGYKNCNAYADALQSAAVVSDYEVVCKRK